MEKQDIPNKEVILNNKFKLSEYISNFLLNIFIIISILFSLIISIYFLVINKDMLPLARLGYFIFKGLIFSIIFFYFVITLKYIFYNRLKNKIKSEERIENIKLEIKQEILKEVKNGRYSKTR